MTDPDPAAQYVADARAVLMAHEVLGYPGLTQDEVAQRQIARALVSATLALAEEQRTANLIAAMRFASANGQGDYQMKMAEQVAARLGVDR